MRGRVAIAVVATLEAMTLSSTAQAQDYRYSYGDRYDYDRYHGDYYNTGYDRDDWRDRQRWERHRAREERRAHERWLREHRRHYHDYDRDYYR
jgi:hypothetical protein